ncbi:MAG: M50 family metallopeptidase [Pseudobdellovibrionaceae bacterium]
MFGKQMKLMTLAGFEVKIDTSWIFLAFLIIWSLSTGYFPLEVENLRPSTYWIMGTIGALGLFVSLILHEFSHSLVARKMGLPIRGITLFIFGGVAELTAEPEKAKTEFWMAIAGPLTSVALGIIFYIFTKQGQASNWSEATLVVLRYLWRLNFTLAAFNMLPGFPLDGGRVFRSLLWAWKKDLRWATHWAVRTGSFIGTLMILLGFFGFMSGDFIIGIWWVILALFLKTAAKTSELQMDVRQHFKGEPVRRYVNSHPITIGPHVTLNEAIDNYFYKFHHRNFPVVENGHLLGIVNIHDLKKASSEEWRRLMIQDVYTKTSSANTIRPEMDTFEVLQKMNNEGKTLLLVSDDRFVGIITIKDLLSYLSMKLNFENESKKI